MIALDGNGGCSYAMIGGRPVVGGYGAVGATTSTYDRGSYHGQEAQVVELPQLRTATSTPAGTVNFPT